MGVTADTLALKRLVRQAWNPSTNTALDAVIAEAVREARAWYDLDPRPDRTLKGGS